MEKPIKWKPIKDEESEFEVSIPDWERDDDSYSYKVEFTNSEEQEEKPSELEEDFWDWI